MARDEEVVTTSSARGGRIAAGPSVPDAAGHPYESLDLRSEEFSEAFDHITSDMVRRCPVAKTSAGWLLTRLEDVRSAANDWQTFSSGVRGCNPWRPDGAALFLPTEVDPPRHNRFKQPFLKLFAARAVAELEPEMRLVARQLIADFQGVGTCELASVYTRRFVGTIFFRLLLGQDVAASEELLELCYRWLLPPVEGQAAAAKEYERRVEEILRRQAASTDRSPVVEAVLGLEDESGPASWKDKCMTLSLLIVAGLDTTVNAITSALAYLADHSEDLRTLVHQPELLPEAVEEFLRLFSPVFVLGRTVMKDVVVGGQQLRAGDYALLSWAVSSRDPDVFDRPLEFDLHRPARPHLAFGTGIHRCLGSHLARVEMRVALEEFLAAIPRFERAPGSDIHWHTGIGRGVGEVHVNFEPSV